MILQIHNKGIVHNYYFPTLFLFLLIMQFLKKKNNKDSKRVNKVLRGDSVRLYRVFNHSYPFIKDLWNDKSRFF